MTATTLVGHVVLLAIGRSPTPAPWSLDDEVARARKASGTRPAISPTSPGEAATSEARAEAASATFADVPCAFAARADSGVTRWASPPPMPARLVYAAFYGGFAFQVARALLL